MVRSAREESAASFSCMLGVKGWAGLPGRSQLPASRVCWGLRGGPVCQGGVSCQLLVYVGG